MAIDNDRSVILLLLDLPAAFDTVDDHSILLLRLQNRFGIRNIALNWFHSYLHSRELVQLLSTKKTLFVQFDDKNMKFVRISNDPKSNILGYRAIPNKRLDMITVCFC